MTRPRILRLLRIALSAVCLVLCAASMALWARSYSWIDRLKLNYVVYLEFQSVRGVQLFVVTLNPWTKYRASKYKADLRRLWHWTLSSKEVPFRTKYARVGFKWYRDPQHFELFVPSWMTAAISGVLAAVMWIPLSKRFSLRTLLLATTLVAIVLGLVVAMSRTG